MNAVVNKTTISFRLRSSLVDILKKRAKESNRSLNNFVECVLIEAMSPIPNQETLEAMNEARSNKNLKGFSSVESLMSYLEEIENCGENINE